MGALLATLLFVGAAAADMMPADQRRIKQLG
jgi:hypothetical protein